MEFDIIINDSLINQHQFLDSDLYLHKNKYILSLINDFEDGKWRYNKFQNFIWDNIIETALSQQERESLVDKDHTRLTRAAQNLRFSKTNNKEGGELAEIFLYGIMRQHYHALAIVPKIFYKQNNQDYAKGADSVHILIDNNNDDFSLWFGEAKFYNSIENKRLDTIISSVGEMLKTDKIKKENRIITNILDLDLLDISDKIKKDIKITLSEDNSIDNLKNRIHIPILLLHECSITNRTTILNQGYKEEIKRYHLDRALEYFSRQENQLKDVFQYYNIKFHIILFPVPNKDEIVNKFTKFAQFYRE